MPLHIDAARGVGSLIAKSNDLHLVDRYQSTNDRRRHGQKDRQPNGIRLRAPMPDPSATARALALDYDA